MKTPLIVLVSMMIGFVGFYFFNQYQGLQAENQLLRDAAEVENSAVPTSKPETNIEPVEEENKATDKIKVTGTLGYPSEGIPPMEVYAFDASNESAYTSVKTQQNQTTFNLELEPGDYYFVAYPQDTDQLAGGYTQMVPCGLLASCTDHSLIPVTISTSSPTSGVIQITDWYAPINSFPAKP